MRLNTKLQEQCATQCRRGPMRKGSMFLLYTEFTPMTTATSKGRLPVTLLWLADTASGVASVLRLLMGPVGGIWGTLL